MTVATLPAYDGQLVLLLLLHGLAELPVCEPPLRPPRLQHGRRLLLRAEEVEHPGHHLLLQDVELQQTAWGCLFVCLFVLLMFC